MRIGRNERCPCGSGKKFKKCCLNKLKTNITFPKGRSDLLLNVTGEPFQPSRVYFKIINKDVIEELLTFRCIQDTEKLKWCYDAEVANKRFNHYFKQKPPCDQRVVLGSFTVEDDEIYLDVDSFDRALLAIDFFANNLEGFVEVSDIAVVNRFFDSSEEIPLNYDVYFKSDEMKHRDPEVFMNQLVQIKEAYGVEVALKYNELDSKITTLIERLPVNYQEEGMRQVTTALKMRCILAEEHWHGNLLMTMDDVLNRVMARVKQ